MTPDIVHIQHEFGLFGSQWGVQVIDLILRYALSGVPVVTTLHTVYDDAGSQQNTILRLIVSESSAVIVHEDYQKEILLKNFGHEYEDKIHVIHHGVRNTLNIKDAKSKLKLEGKKVILLCGYFRPTKGFHRMVKIFTQIYKKNHDAVLLIAGKARGLEYLDYVRELFESINISTCNDNIIVLRDQELVETIVKLISNDKLRQQFRNNIRSYIKKDVGWDNVAKSHIEIYQSVVRIPYGRARHVFWE